MSHPFGTTITATTVIETMSGFTSWEDRYRQVIMWGKLLPKMDEALKQEQLLVAGCESKVWLASEFDGEYWHFQADSDARIVRGLIALVLAAFHHQTSEHIQQFDTDAYFAQLGLIDHLSPSRGNGLRAIVEQIKQVSR
ncbi:cysteine desulfurase sulfur acceptor subunit CsdE [Vibrio rumoiensis]|uniref:Cysteine desulfurase, sulfur acceptor subunit CsdE n=1 Tax=Vibrio rumoiensis 1S-45 TaxID=1188252 RepID=A0A1E5E3W5_9VIBR|nr:cysteine desulfurase sulfur acceptor subunit CsdE [Vibrio rumoiensis]OEF26307.1 cysteine desulfurase, sulfur acceptor subunit CsdE [Vibrio rumoiensis 1S-45]